MLVIATAVPSALGGFLIGRWAVAVIAPAFWALYVFRLTQDWWGYGVGDGWQYGLIVGVRGRRSRRSDRCTRGEDRRPPSDGGYSIVTV